FGVKNTFLPVAQQLQRLVNDVLDSNAMSNGLPPGFHTARVKRAIQELSGELNALVTLAQPISHVITPLPEFGLPPTLPPSIAGVFPNSLSTSADQNVAIIGTGFTPDAVFTLEPPSAAGVTGKPTFNSLNNLAVALFDLTNVEANNNWKLRVRLPDGQNK